MLVYSTSREIEHLKLQLQFNSVFYNATQRRVDKSLVIFKYVRYLYRFNKNTRNSTKILQPDEAATTVFCLKCV